MTHDERRRLLVTGSASGIGAATARLARERGYDVLGLDRHEADVCADLSTAQGRSDALAQVLPWAEQGLDAVVPCAGVSAAQAVTVAVNFFGVTELLTGLQPHLARSSAPRVAVIGSITGTYRPHADVLEALLAGDADRAAARAEERVAAGGGMSLYPTSKHALARWVRRTCVSPGWADAGIALNAVAPGTVLTPMTEGLFADPEMRQLMDDAVPMPLNSYAPPEAVAELLLWLVSPANTHVTGQVVYVDGGAEAVLRDEETF